MSKGDLSIIDTDQWKPVQSPGLRAPRHQVPYDSGEVQKILSESFGVMFPNITEQQGGLKSYRAVNVRKKDVMLQAKPVKNINDIPKAEMMRLMEGWIRLRRKLQEGEVSKGVSSILLNFRVPNPRQSLDRYLLYKEGDEERLIIRWGYETKESPAVSLERAISILMDVPLGHMRSILSTSMSPTTATVPVGQMLASAEAGEGGASTHARIGSSGGYKVLTGVVALSVVMLSLGIYGISKALSMKGLDPQEAVSQPVLKETESYIAKAVVEAEPHAERAVEMLEKEEPAQLVATEEELQIKVEKVEAREKIEPSVRPSVESAVINVQADQSKPELSMMLGGEVMDEHSTNKKEDPSIKGMFSGQKDLTQGDLLDDMTQ